MALFLVDDTQIQDFIDEGNLDQLDNMVTEFAMNMNDSAMEPALADQVNNGNTIRPAA